MSDKNMDFKLNAEEIRLLLYWRERCNQGHGNIFICPLYCVEKGNPFCHALGDRLLDKHKTLNKFTEEDVE